MTRSKRVITPDVLLLALDAHLREAVNAPELELEQPHPDEVTDPGLEDEHSPRSTFAAAPAGRSCSSQRGRIEQLSSVPALLVRLMELPPARGTRYRS